MWTKPLIVEDCDTQYGWRVKHIEAFYLGEDTDIGYGTYIQAEYGVYIGPGTQIGSHCAIYSKNTEGWTMGAVKIHENVKIGTHSTILPGVTIGKGAVIGAYSLVKIDIPAGALAYGIPAKVVRENK